MDQLLTALSLEPNDRHLFQVALTHPSANKSKNYERLEFLGDAVIELITTQYIFHHFPKYPEGKMTKLRARVVSRPSLALFARELSLGSYISFSSGERHNKGPERDSNLSNSFEALIGATYLDLGFSEAERVFLSLAKPMLDRGYQELTGSDNPKGKLQETLQAIKPLAPIYHTLSESGPDHRKVFKVEVTWGDISLAIGEGSSKKFAESNAATKALEEKKWNS